MDNKKKAQVAARTLDRLETFRESLAAEGILLKRGVLRVEVWVREVTAGKVNLGYCQSVFEWKA